MNADERKEMREHMGRSPNESIFQVSRVELLALLQAADRVDYAECELKNCQAMNRPLGESCVRSQAAETEAKQALATAHTFIPFPLETFKDFREEYDAVADSLEKQRAKGEKMEAELERKTAELVHVIKQRNAGRKVMAKLVECWESENGTLDVDHEHEEHAEIDGKHVLRPVCGWDHDACDRGTCPAIWVLNDAAKLAKSEPINDDDDEEPETTDFEKVESDQ